MNSAMLISVAMALSDFAMEIERWYCHEIEQAVWCKKLQTGDVETRRNAAIVFNFFKPPQAVPALIKALNDPDAEVRMNASAAFIQSGNYATDGFRDAAKPAIPILAGSLNHKDGVVRRNAAHALFSFGPLAKPTLPALKKAASENSDTLVRVYATAAIARLSEGAERDKMVRSLIEFSNDKDPEVFNVSFDVFPWIGVEALPILKDGLKDKNARLRDWTIWAIEAMTWKVGAKDKIPDDVIDSLIIAINDKDKDVADSAMYVVTSFGARAAGAVPVMLKRLSDPDSDIRARAIIQLGHFGAWADSAIPALTKALHDDDPLNRSYAETSLREIEKAKKEKAKEK